jgi:hypothetical protein
MNSEAQPMFRLDRDADRDSAPQVLGTFGFEWNSIGINDHSIFTQKETFMGRGILLWLLGVPIPIIILILLFWR